MQLSRSFVGGSHSFVVSWDVASGLSASLPYEGTCPLPILSREDGRESVCPLARLRWPVDRSSATARSSIFLW